MEVSEKNLALLRKQLQYQKSIGDDRAANLTIKQIQDMKAKLTPALNNLNQRLSDDALSRVDPFRRPSMPSNTPTPNQEEPEDEDDFDDEDFAEENPENDNYLDDDQPTESTEEPTFGEPINDEEEEPEEKSKGREEAEQLEKDALQNNGQDGQQTQNSNANQEQANSANKPQEVSSQRPDSAPTSDKERIGRTKIRDRLKNKGSELGQKGKDIARKGGQAASRAARATGQATKAAAKASAQAAKAAAQAITKAIGSLFTNPATAPYAWAAVGIIILLIILGFVLFAMFGGSGDPARGTTQTQATSPIKDKDWITKLRLYAGDKDVKQEITQQLKDDLKSALQKVGEDPSVSEADKKTATDLLAKVDTLPADKDNFFNALNSLINKYSANCAGLLQNEIFAINSYDAKGIKDNGKLSNGSELYPAMCGFLIYLSNHASELGIKQKQVHITFDGGHKKCARYDDKGRCVVSFHWSGNALDLTTDNGLSFSDFAPKLQKWIVDKKTELMSNNIWPNESFGPKPYSYNIDSCGITAKDPNPKGIHETHIHLGFNECK